MHKQPVKFIGTHVDEATYVAISESARAEYRSLSAHVRSLIEASVAKKTRKRRPAATEAGEAPPDGSGE